MIMAMIAIGCICLLAGFYAGISYQGFLSELDK